MKSHPFVASLIVSGSIFCASASAQLLNGDFSNGLDGWTVEGSNTVAPDGTAEPKDFKAGLGTATASDGTALLTTGPGSLTATRLSQGFSPTFERIPGKLGNGVGQLRLSDHFLKGHYAPTVNFTFQALSKEAAGARFDFFKAKLNSQNLALVPLRDSSANQAGAFGFPRGTGPIAFSANIGAVLASASTLSFIISDTIDRVVDSAVAISNVRLTYVLEDADAINSAQHSGLPVALAQRQILLNVAENANRDVNARLFRLRSQGVESGALAPIAEDAKQTKQVLPPEKRWEFFAGGNYGNRDVDTIGSVAGFNTDLFTATAGFEYKVTPHLTLGLAATRMESDNDLGALGHTDVEGFGFAGYASFFAKNFYADLLYGIGAYNHQIHRNTGFGNTASARVDSLTNSIQFNTGYNIHLGRVLTGPIVSLDWVHGNIDGYSESGSSKANLTVNAQALDSLVSHLGWQVSIPIPTGFGVVTPQVRAAWVHEYFHDSQQVGASLSDSPYYLVNGSNVRRIGSFSASTQARPSGSDYLSAAGGVGIQFGARISVVLDYETRIFQNNSFTQNVALTGSIKF